MATPTPSLHRLTLIHAAAEQAHLDAVTVLLSHPKTVLNCTPKKAQTPFQLAKLHNHSSICSLFSRSGAQAKVEQPSRGKKRESARCKLGVKEGTPRDT